LLSHARERRQPAHGTRESAWSSMMQQRRLLCAHMSHIDVHSTSLEFFARAPAAMFTAALHAESVFVHAAFSISFFRVAAARRRQPAARGAITGRQRYAAAGKIWRAALARAATWCAARHGKDFRLHDARPPPCRLFDIFAPALPAGE
jgi:hypothetical protein